MTINAAKHFLDGIVARLVALALAAGIGAMLYFNWAENVKMVYSGTFAPIYLPGNAPHISVKMVNPALQACLDRRLGDVEQMKQEGLVSETKYDEFQRRAKELCRAHSAN